MRIEERWLEHLGEVREDLLPLIVINLLHEGLIAVEISSLNTQNGNENNYFAETGEDVTDGINRQFHQNM